MAMLVYQGVGGPQVDSGVAHSPTRRLQVDDTWSEEIQVEVVLAVFQTKYHTH